MTRLLLVTLAALLGGCATRQPTQRYAWVTGLKPEKVAYYEQLHAQPWPSVNQIPDDPPMSHPELLHLQAGN
jgi:hypothetical protein